MDYSLLDHYRAIERTAFEMLQAARADDWNEVIRLEAACAVLISRLKAKLRSEALSPDAMSEKAHLMHRVLTYDAEIRRLTGEEEQVDLELPLSVPNRTIH